MWGLDAGDLVAGAIGLLAVIIGGLGLWKGGTANTIASDARSASWQANTTARESNRIASEANNLSREANATAMESLKEARRSSNASERSASAAEQSWELQREAIERASRADLRLTRAYLSESGDGVSGIHFKVAVKNVGEREAQQLSLEAPALALMANTATDPIPSGGHRTFTFRLCPVDEPLPQEWELDVSIQYFDTLTRSIHWVFSVEVETTFSEAKVRLVSGDQGFLPTPSP